MYKLSYLRKTSELIETFTKTLLSFGTATSMMSALLFVLLITMMSGLLCCRAWSVWTAKFHKILAFAFSSTVRGWCWYHAVWFSLKSNSFKRGLCTYLHTFSCRCRYFVGSITTNQRWYGKLFQLLVDTTDTDSYLWICVVVDLSLNISCCNGLFLNRTNHRFCWFFQHGRFEPPCGCIFIDFWLC